MYKWHNRKAPTAWLPAAPSPSDAARCIHSPGWDCISKAPTLDWSPQRFSALDYKPGMGKALAKSSTSRLNCWMFSSFACSLRCAPNAFSLPSLGVDFFSSIAILMPL